ncbi:hypothetical protein BGY98DRAFT_89770 [Russula aff. rugulosa BPL654]|nr:hypothetical protein BGY98DRAFT_89770 [Russula aff. rugulosa BPL654]
MKFSLGLAAALFLPVLVNAWSPHSDSIQINVQVAPGGQLVYSPSNFAACNGTTVTFCFPLGSTLHSVTQGVFEKPCVHLAPRGGNPAGFNSGLQSGKEFTIEITDDREPIFFFCKAPGHCGLGMVGLVHFRMLYSRFWTLCIGDVCFFLFS